MNVECQACHRILPLSLVPPALIEPLKTKNNKCVVAVFNNGLWRWFLIKSQSVWFEYWIFSTIITKAHETFESNSSIQHMKEMIMFLSLLSSQVFKLVIGASLFPFSAISLEKYRTNHTVFVKIYQATAAFTIHNSATTWYHISSKAELCIGHNTGLQHLHYDHIQTNHHHNHHHHPHCLLCHWF